MKNFGASQAALPRARTNGNTQGRRVANAAPAAAAAAHYIALPWPQQPATTLRNDAGDTQQRTTQGEQFLNVRSKAMQAGIALNGRLRETVLKNPESEHKIQ